MTDPVAYHLTWTTYGTWLPGDERGWTDSAGQLREPDAVVRNRAMSLLAHDPLSLTAPQQAVVDDTIRRHCTIRRWHLRAVHVGATHVHVVVTADKPRKVVLSELKAWCSRKLNEGFGRKPDWWTEDGNALQVWDEQHLAEVVGYVTERQ